MAPRVDLCFVQPDVEPSGRCPYYAKVTEAGYLCWRVSACFGFEQMTTRG